MASAALLRRHRIDLTPIHSTNLCNKIYWLVTDQPIESAARPEKSRLSTTETRRSYPGGVTSQHGPPLRTYSTAASPSFASFGSAYPNHLSTPADRNRNRRLSRCLSSKTTYSFPRLLSPWDIPLRNGPLTAQQLKSSDCSAVPALGSFEMQEYPKPLGQKVLDRRLLA